MAIAATERTSAIDAAIHCHGMSYVLNIRAVRLKWFINILRFSGLVGVTLVGAVVMLTPGSQGDFTWVAWIAGLISVANFVASLISMNWGCDQGYHDYVESIKENNWLASEFANLFSDTVLTDTKWRIKYDERKTIHSRRKDKDAGTHISESERHKGYRAGLLQFQQTCGQCGAVPQDMNPGQCHSCGQFK